MLKQSTFLVAGLLLLSATYARSLPGDTSHPNKKSPQQAHPASHVDPSRVARSQNFGNLPLSFEPNQGQADRSVSFLSHSVGASLSLSSSEAVFELPLPPKAGQKSGKAPHASKRAAFTTMRMQLLGAAAHAASRTEQPLEGHANYFTGRDPKQWRTGIPTYGKVGFQDVYPGVDLVYYGNQQHLEYDFVVAPHADPKQIQLHFEGAQKVSLNAAGALIVRTGDRDLIWQKPTVYQQDTNGKRKVAAHFRLKRLSNGQTSVSFALGRYDTARPLVIDPVLIYSTYYLASSYAPNPRLAVDISGNVYIATTLSTIYQSYIKISKLNATGTSVLYSTTLGPDLPSINSKVSQVAVDSSGSLYLTGYTDATNFPVTPGAFRTQRTNVYADVFVTKLNPAGDGLAYSTFIGRGEGSGIALDSSGAAYVTGITDATDFPTTSGAFQTVNHAPTAGNAFVTKLNPTGSALIYSTYLGGSVDASNNAFYSDGGVGIAVDANGAAYVTGRTASTDFPTTPGAFQRVDKNKQSASTIFVSKLNPTGTALLYSTYFGGTIQETPAGIAVDSSGAACITGYTTSYDLPITPGAFMSTYPAGAGYHTGFVARFKADGSGLIYSTYLGGQYNGGAAEVNPNGIAVDSSGAAYVIGGTKATDFPTTLGAFKRTQKPFNYPNAFVTKLNPIGTALLYSTFLGGTVKSEGTQGGEIGQSIALDRTGNAYVAGYTESSDFPTTRGALLTTPARSFLTKLSTVPIFPDFNDDGSTDLLIQNASTGQIVSGFLQGTQWFDGAYFSQTPPNDFALVGVGDFSGLGSTALVLQNRTTNQIAFWYATGTKGATIDGGNFVNTTPAADWKVVGVGDFNGDRRSDLVFQNQTTGQLALWYMNGYLYQSGNSLDTLPPTGWKVVGVGDFNKDGFPDIVFQDQATGQVALWYMQGKTRIGGVTLANQPAAGWKVVGVGDYNGDGSADLLFQNQTTNQAVVWYLQDGAYTGGGLLSQTPPAGWKIVAPR